MESSEHYVGESQQFPDYVLTDYKTVGKRLSDAGMNLIFTGHFHANDIVLKGLWHLEAL